jgi:hypothetical protein
VFTKPNSFVVVNGDRHVSLPGVPEHNPGWLAGAGILLAVGLLIIADKARSVPRVPPERRDQARAIDATAVDPIAPPGPSWCVWWSGWRRKSSRRPRGGASKRGCSPTAAAAVVRRDPS